MGVARGNIHCGVYGFAGLHPCNRGLELGKKPPLAQFDLYVVRGGVGQLFPIHFNS